MNPLTKELDYFLTYFNKLYDEYVSLYKTYVEGERSHNIGIKSGVIVESGRYIPTILKEKINKMTFHHNVLKNRFENVNISLEVFQPIIKKKLQKYIIRVVYVIIYFVNNIHPLHGIKNLNIKIVCSPFKKQLSSNGDISTFNVNTGVTTTYHNIDKADILIYREEEVLKVLIHELLHAFGVDSKWTTPQIEAPLNVFFGMNTVHSNESFTDTYACLLNVFLATRFLFHDKKQVLPEEYKYIFSLLVEYERSFIVNQANKLIPLLGLEKNSKTGKLVNKVSNRVEDTHVISYYILKGLNFVNLPMFLTYLRIHRWKSTMDGAKYVQYLTRVLQMKISYDLVTQKHEEVDLLGNSSKKLMKGVKRLLKTVYNVRSLRMSCIDISTI